MVTASPVRPRARFASPERWQAALARALANPWLAPPAVEPPAEPPDPVPTGRRRRVVVRDVAGVLSANLDGRLVTSSLHFERDEGGAWAIGVDEDGAGSCAALVYLKPEDSADAAVTRLLSALAHVNRPPADEDDRAAD